MVQIAIISRISCGVKQDVGFSRPESRDEDHEVYMTLEGLTAYLTSGYLEQDISITIILRGHIHIGTYSRAVYIS